MLKTQLKIFLENQIGYQICDKKLQKLVSYANLLEKWNQKINMISQSNIEIVWERHILDSAQLIRHFTLENEHCILTDLGSGGGLPAIVLAILGSFKVQAIESDIRKCVFLNEVKNQLDLRNLTVFNRRIEDISVDCEKADYVTARALKDLSLLLGFSIPLIKNSGRCLFLKGKRFERELQNARQAYQFEAKIYPSMTSTEGCILECYDVSLGKC